MRVCSTSEFDEIVASLNGGVPDAEMFRHMSTLFLDDPAAHRLQDISPFSAEYREAALELYLKLRAHADKDYIPQRDEAPSFAVPEHVWSQLPPWSFRDTGMIAEHLLSWGHILSHLALPPGGSVLEYGPGSGQILLTLARMGFRAHGVDVDAVALEGIRLQAESMRLEVSTERALFGEGFGQERFDAIIFYEAFHHALDFQSLLRRLLDRLNPGGRLILCGEPIVPEAFPGIPYPWGPRMDALSVFCMRRFGWMELGFTHSFFMKAVQHIGWTVTFHPFAACARAHLYVLQVGQQNVAAVSELHTIISERSLGPIDLPLGASRAEASAEQLGAELEAIYASTSWRLTGPLRSAGTFLGQLSRKIKRRSP